MSVGERQLTLEPEELNPRLTKWLIEYNFNRPHQSLVVDILRIIPYNYNECVFAKNLCLGG